MASQSYTRKQKTLSKSFSVTGLGIFSGNKIFITCHPASENTGVIFQRDKLAIPACVDSIHSTPRTMILGKNGTTVQCVEHLLAAFKAFNLDNVLVEVNGGEIPICDGSAEEFVRAIRKSGVKEQEQSVVIHTLTSPIWWSQQNIHLVALPSDELRYSYTLNYPGHPLLQSQFYSFAMSEEGFVQEIASARTFALFEEIETLIKSGVINAGGLGNGVIIKGNEILNPDGLKFKDEMVRHKILDLIGDLALIGVPLTAHFIAIRSGHASHAQLARKVMNAIGY